MEGLSCLVLGGWHGVGWSEQRLGSAFLDEKFPSCLLSEGISLCSVCLPDWMAAWPMWCRVLVILVFMFPLVTMGTSE